MMYHAYGELTNVPHLPPPARYASMRVEQLSCTHFGSVHLIGSLEALVGLQSKGPSINSCAQIHHLWHGNFAQDIIDELGANHCPHLSDPKWSKVVLDVRKTPTTNTGYVLLADMI